MLSLLRNNLPRLLALCALILGACAASAHPINAGLSVVEYNPRTDQLEAIHHLYMHDLEDVVSEAAGRRVELLSDEEALRAAVLGSLEQFSLRGADGQAVAFELVGAEIARGMLIIYTQAPCPGDLSRVTVHSTMLHADFPKQINTVNVEIHGVLQTARFAPGDPPATLEFAAR